MKNYPILLRPFLLILAGIALGTGLLATGALIARAQQQSVSLSTSPFYACENSTTAAVNPATITQNPAALSCVAPETATGWTGTSPFTTSVCSEVGLSGPAQQENLIFCQGIEPDGGFVYKAAIAAASAKVIVGTPLAQLKTRDWSGSPIIYETFTSGLHMEWHEDNVVRIYNTANQRVF